MQKTITAFFSSFKPLKNDFTLIFLCEIIKKTQSFKKMFITTSYRKLIHNSRNHPVFQTLKQPSKPPIRPYSNFPTRPLSTYDITVKELNITKQSTNKFYELATQGLNTYELQKQSKEFAESYMKTINAHIIYHSWFLSLHNIQSIVSGRNDLKKLADQLSKEDATAPVIQQIDEILNRMHPELKKFLGDNESSLQAQKIIFGEYDYGYPLNNEVLSKLELYIRIYHPITYHKLFHVHASIQSFNTAMVDFIRKQANISSHYE